MFRTIAPCFAATALLAAGPLATAQMNERDTTRMNDRGAQRPLDAGEGGYGMAERWEFSITGSGSSDKELDTGSFGFTADVGYYLNQPVSVGVRQNLNFADTGGDSDWDATTTGYVDYHFFSDRSLKPFVGVSLGFLYGDVEESFVAGPEAGLK